VSQNSVMTGDVPTIKNSKSGVIIRHKEYITDVQAANAFTNLVFPINPGLPATFPFLSQISMAFEEYEFRGLMFEFKSMSSDALLMSATNSSLGTVVMATEYDVIDPAFASKIQMENHQYSCSAKPSTSFMHPIECARGLTPQTHLYTRNAQPPANADLRLYDLGNFNIAVQGMQAANGTCGELWCTYEIEFFKPQLGPYLGYELPYDLYTFNTVGVNNTPMGPNPVANAVKQVGSKLGTQLISSTNGNAGVAQGTVTIRFPTTVQSGVYNVFIQIGSTLAVGATTGALYATSSMGILLGGLKILNAKYMNYPVNIAASFPDLQRVGGVSPALSDLMGFSQFIQLTGPFSIPLSGVAGAQPYAQIMIYGIGQNAGDLYPDDNTTNNAGFLLIQQVNPGIVGLPIF